MIRLFRKISNFDKKTNRVNHILTPSQRGGVPHLYLRAKTWSKMLDDEEEFILLGTADSGSGNNLPRYLWLIILIAIIVLVLL